MDKDILGVGAKVYSEDVCVFVPKVINTLFLLNKKRRGANPIGVYYLEKVNKYQVSVSRYGKPKRLGRFDSEYQAFTAYRQEKTGNDKLAILVAPPFDFYDKEIFETYARAFYSVVAEKETLRFFYGKNEILDNRRREFKPGDPAILAMGGLVHHLINTTPWMDQQQENMFVVEEGV